MLAHRYDGWPMQCATLGWHTLDPASCIFVKFGMDATVSMVTFSEWRLATEKKS